MEPINQILKDVIYFFNKKKKEVTTQKSKLKGKIKLSKESNTKIKNKENKN